MPAVEELGTRVECLTEYRTAEGWASAFLRPVGAGYRQRIPRSGNGVICSATARRPGLTSVTAAPVRFATAALYRLRDGICAAPGIGAGDVRLAAVDEPDRAPYRGWAAV